MDALEEIKQLFF